MHRLVAAKSRLPLLAAFSGFTASWLHGIDVDPCNPIEITVATGAGISARAGMLVRRAALVDTDVVTIRGLRVTSAVRTVGEVCSRMSLVEAVVITDEALHKRILKLDQLLAWADANAGRRGIQNLRQVIANAEPAAESPMESRLRMLLVLGGLPRPEAQVSIHDRWGRFVARPDLYYAHRRLGIEYDGAVHRESLAEDNRRQNKLIDIGVRLLRFTAKDVLGHPDAVIGQVRSVLDDARANPATAGIRASGAVLKAASASTRG